MHIARRGELTYPDEKPCTNRGIGYFKDDQALLMRAVEYILSHRDTDRLEVSGL